MLEKLNATFGGCWSYEVDPCPEGSYRGRITVFSRCSDDEGSTDPAHLWADDHFVERFRREAIAGTPGVAFVRAAKLALGID